MEDEFLRPLVPNPLVVVKRLEAGAMLMDSATGQFFELNQIGVEIWSELEKGIEVERIVDTIATRYNVARERVADDTRTLIRHLLAQGIVRTSARR